MRKSSKEEWSDQVPHMVISRPTRRRDARQAHYTSSREIGTYMASRLRATAGDLVWEPCAGHGHLIDAVLRESAGVSIRASEIDATAADHLRHKYADIDGVAVSTEDALDVGEANLLAPAPDFNRVIANPPYGAYQSHARRAWLKRRFPFLYVRESYGVLLYHAFSLLRHDGRLVFIVPDTFLWLHRHEYLRRVLLTQSTIDEIALFPSKFFPGIRFGYSGLCVISLTKQQPIHSHQIRLVENLRDAQVLLELCGGDAAPTGCSISLVNQRGLLERQHCELYKPVRSVSLCLNERRFVTLGDVADVKTGFYSGNDRRWIRRASAGVPRSRQYDDIQMAMVFRERSPALEGIADTAHFVPILRGGAASFVRPTQWYVDWSVEAVREYRKPGENPARFQNSQFYFHAGIGVPMVASRRLTAALLEDRLFDQGIVGIFPRDKALLNFLLGFLNTELATKLLRQINPTANNSANYLKRLPVVVPTSEEIATASLTVEKALMEARASGEVHCDTRGRLERLYRMLWCHEPIETEGAH
jgi:adenine-specific DNA-methyltransferase